ncbi:Putative Ca2+/H+ antiporter, TMEM165/GDT1 family [Dethiosulfatibacter aminovorans DSM 17477]|uniref:GDT1 family protein n=1 Tax=Dethiosulfatibacter aminovorans DSM 17477 TaxID=1121476 RepID=A0A1M6ATR9_9FIRM|nr:TMEM165/GDT1 family protein [Dethiosulfatibacter aminovorans]SHI39919.1 Putative Ca2+/H+ antiporter, TMEM165/GDT1 family [Dethiosulfatibacter aminovorans DSM 17477]
MINEFIKAFSLIFLAEMGDKTQLLALAFATQYRLISVLTGIGIGAFLNHSLAIALGIYISSFIDGVIIQMIAGAAFVGFSIWTLRVEDEDDEDSGKTKGFGPVLTVAVAFFIGELGDKTQLTAVALAIDSSVPVLTLAGTVSGMLATGLLGIIVGRYIGGRIPELTVKIFASVIFMGLGLVKLYNSVPVRYLTTTNIVLFLLIVSVALAMSTYSIVRMKRQGMESALKARFRELQEYYVLMNSKIDSVCLGTGACVNCKGPDCPVDCIKSLVRCRLRLGTDMELDYLSQDFETSGKSFDKEKVIDCIRLTEEAMEIERNSDETRELETVMALLRELLD